MQGRKECNAKAEAYTATLYPRTYPPIRRPCAGVVWAAGVGASRVVVLGTTSGSRHPPVAHTTPARKVVTTRRVCRVASLARGSTPGCALRLASIALSSRRRVALLADRFSASEGLRRVEVELDLG